VIESFAGAVLAGGRSTRMGCDKATLNPFGRGELLEIAVQSLRASGAIAVGAVGCESSRSASDDHVTVPDSYPGEGPLGGIITALRWSPVDLVVVIACDMPFLTEGPIAQLVSHAREQPSLAGVFAELDGRVQPLTAIWRRSLTLERLEAGFKSGERAPRRLLDLLPIDTIKCADPDALVDLDSPADVERYAALARERTTGDS